MNPVTPGGPPISSNILKSNDFAQLEKSAGVSGRLTISNANARTPELVAAKYTFKDRVISVLKNFSLFQGFDAVKPENYRTW